MRASQTATAKNGKNDSFVPSRASNVAFARSRNLAIAVTSTSITVVSCAPIHSGQVSVADGTKLAAQKLARVLTNDPGMGVIRHADAGYDIAVDTAKERHVHVPMLDIE